MKDEKQAALAAIQQINAVDGFDPSPLVGSGIRRPQYP